jgi:bifunctional polynucleotide phosphatase/kinase
MVACKEDQILNPKTGRCVKRTGKIGIEILSNIMSQINIKEKGPRVIDIGHFKECKDMACFDFDFTIVRPKDGRTFPKDKNDWEWLRNSVPETIQKISKTHCIYLFTDQSKEFKIDMIKVVCNLLKVPMRVVIGFGPKTGIKKPNPLLFTENVKVNFNQKKSFYVGDASGKLGVWSDVDKVFAKNIGMVYKTPEEFFQENNLKRNIDTNSYHKKNQELIIMIGYPASGKSTFAKEKFEKYGYEVLSGDILKTVPKILKQLDIHLKDNKSVVIDATNGKFENRSKYEQLAKKYKIPVRCFHFTMSIEDAMLWEEKRRNITGKSVPKIAFYLYRKSFNPPSKSECEIIEIKN